MKVVCGLQQPRVLFFVHLAVLLFVHLAVLLIILGYLAWLAEWLLTTFMAPSCPGMTTICNLSWTAIFGLLPHVIILMVLFRTTSA